MRAYRQAAFSRKTAGISGLVPPFGTRQTKGTSVQFSRCMCCRFGANGFLSPWQPPNVRKQLHIAPAQAAHGMLSVKELIGYVTDYTEVTPFNMMPERRLYSSSDRSMTRHCGIFWRAAPRCQTHKCCGIGSSLPRGDGCAQSSRASQTTKLSRSHSFSSSERQQDSCQTS